MSYPNQVEEKLRPESPKRIRAVAISVNGSYLLTHNTHKFFVEGLDKKLRAGSKALLMPLSNIK
jgi:hypothetical protein